MPHILTHWGRVTHICVSKLTIIGSDNGLSPGRRQGIIWTNVGILSIGPLILNFSEISIGIKTFSFNKMHLKMSSGKWRPFCLELRVLTYCKLVVPYDVVNIGSGSDLLPVWRTANIWASVELLSIWPAGTNWSEIYPIIYKQFVPWKYHWKMSYTKYRSYSPSIA